jgi:hypothetical protein
MASSASSPGPDIPGRIRPRPRLSSVAPPFCEQSAGLPSAHQSSRLVSGRSTVRAAGNIDLGMGCQGVAAHGRATKRAKLHLGLRDCRSSNWVVDGQSTSRSEYRNHAAVPQCGGQKAWHTSARRYGAGQSGLAHGEAAQVATTNYAAVPAAMFPGTESCRATLALVPGTPLEQPRLPRRTIAHSRGEKEPSPASSGRSPFNLRHSLGHAQGSSKTRISTRVSAATMPYTA